MIINISLELGMRYNNDNVKSIKSNENKFDLKNIDMDSVVDTESFSDQVTKWANLAWSRYTIYKAISV